jgi:hypothetical protein
MLDPARCSVVVCVNRCKIAGAIPSKDHQRLADELRFHDCILACAYEQ